MYSQGLRSLRSVTLVLLIGTATWLSPPAARAAEGFLLVTHAGNPERAISRKEASRLFLHKLKRWPDGVEVTAFEPLDQDLQDTFNREVHGRSTSSIKSFWNRQTFSGQGSRPEQLPSRDLLRRVAQTRGAVGYVARDTTLPPGVAWIDIEGYPDDLPLEAGAVGAGAEAREAAARRVESRAYDDGRQASVAILDLGPCREPESRRYALVNDGGAEVEVRLQISRFHHQKLKASATKDYSLSPGEEIDLGCSGGETDQRRFALAGVSVTRLPARGREDDRGRLAREAVELASAGACGAEQAGTTYVLRNQLLDRSMRVRVHVHYEAPGRSRSFVRTISLGPGEEERLGCSLDGQERRTFTVEKAEML